MKKRIVILASILIFTMAFMAGCGGSSNNNDKKAEVNPYPNKDITVICAFTAGGSSDSQLRLVEKYWNEMFTDSKLIIQYKTGAGGEVGFTEIAKSKPDGYTMGGINVPHIVLQPLARETQFTPESFDYILQMVDDPQVVIVHKDSPIKDLAQFLEVAKQKNGNMTFGNVGTFTGHHITSLALMDETGVQLTLVPHVGAADMMAAVVGNHLDAAMSNLSDTTPYKDNVRILGISSAERHWMEPDWPTLKEQGVNVVTSITRGIAVPTGVDPAILEVLRERMKKVSENENYKKDMERMGQAYSYVPGDLYKEQIMIEYQNAERLLRKFGEIK